MCEKTTQLFYFFVAIMSLAVWVQGQDSFKGIVPLLTTRAEVEKKFGVPDQYGRYEFAEGMVSILYRDSTCEKSNSSCFCIVPVGTVLEIEITPNYDQYIKDLKLDPKVWEKAEVKGGHVPDIEVYMNHKTGMTYEVNAEDGWIRSIRYNGSKETCEKLSKQSPQ